MWALCLDCAWAVTAQSSGSAKAAVTTVTSTTSTGEATNTASRTLHVFTQKYPTQHVRTCLPYQYKEIQYTRFVEVFHVQSD